MLTVSIVTPKEKEMGKKSSTLPLPEVQIKQHFGDTLTSFRVARITKDWIVIICNESAITKFDKERGLAAGAFKDRRSMAPSRLTQESLDRMKKLSQEFGGRWDSGWKPKKAPPAVVLTPEQKEADFKDRLEDIKKYREEHFQVVVEDHPNWSDSDVNLRITTGGNHWTSVPLTNAEVPKVIEALQDYLTSITTCDKVSCDGGSDG